MKTSYLRISYAETSDLGRQIASQVKSGKVSVLGVDCYVIDQRNGKYDGIKHVLLRSGPPDSIGASINSDLPPNLWDEADPSN